MAGWTQSDAVRPTGTEVTVYVGSVRIQKQASTTCRVASTLVLTQTRAWISAIFVFLSCYWAVTRFLLLSRLSDSVTWPVLCVATLPACEYTRCWYLHLWFAKGEYAQRLSPWPTSAKQLIRMTHEGTQRSAQHESWLFATVRMDHALERCYSCTLFSYFLGLLTFTTIFKWRYLHVNTLSFPIYCR